MFVVIECPLGFVPYVVMSALVVGLVQHGHGVTLSDYGFHSVSDVYISLGTS